MRKNNRVYLGEENGKWKGSKATPQAIHSWLTWNFGNPSKCRRCGEIGKKKNGRWTIEWALIHGKNHDHKEKNYTHLCHKCHIAKYDKTCWQKGNLPWNKGVKWTKELREKIVWNRLEKDLLLASKQYGR